MVRSECVIKVLHSGQTRLDRSGQEWSRCNARSMGGRKQSNLNVLAFTGPAVRIIGDAKPGDEIVLAGLTQVHQSRNREGVFIHQLEFIVNEARLEKAASVCREEINA